jgi:hypothetical protein
MPVWKLQTQFNMDSALPRDTFIITPHVNQQLTSDPQALCDDLADALSAWVSVPMEIKVTAYDAEGSQPVYPAGEAINNPGQHPASNCPREIAVCLSFFTDRNTPRHRGRLYIPFPVLQATLGVNPGVRPDTNLRNKVGALGTIFADLGGADDDWCVYSRADGVARSVSQWWVDDEWDTMRSRGLRATTRTTGIVNE